MALYLPSGLSFQPEKGARMCARFLNVVCFPVMMLAVMTSSGCGLVFVPQVQRFPDPVEYEKVAGMYRVDPELVSRGPGHMIILHPLPRVNEITPEVDSLPQAKYFQQAFNAVPVRMALLSMVIGDQQNV